ncbi:MAG: hypothetical protein ACKVOS_04415 [Sphingorhabdus sp.]|jgi:hypothetical protein|uniref:hypothetical protein n=1 Tax=Sphingorhabdus sp. TaxID=1902408 RepID=UPI0038FCDF79
MPKLFPALAVGIAACISVAFAQWLKPVSIGAYVFWSLWLVLPYAAIGGALILSRKKEAQPLPLQLCVIAIAIAGPMLLADAAFWRPDAQGGMAVLMVPIIQAGLASILLSAAWLASRYRNKG